MSDVATDTDAERDVHAGLAPGTARELRAAAEEYLYFEAELLDDRRLIDWHETLVAEDVDYRVPTRTTRERSAKSEFSDESFHLKEDWGSLKVRVERMENDFAWSEDPPSRNRRQVTNVRVTDYDDGAGELSVKNNLLVHRTRGDDTDPDLLSAERRDTLRRADTPAGWQLVERRVLLDHTVIGTPSLTLIL